ncbi:L-glutamate gamma-semialdehyde dehydrogenase [Spirosoma sp. KCTC 42546]|uniref:L-glutamate gamma-semialdehyde dehydrogenase n=1 Tax=Spirosoma sp. KCTC 42546 TaxID=2520506 RepID=UPI00115766EC|nr:L-glutamate gamma-semialdehyde dehydrogenase [Spirosoma sp. KCTC 42546]QDK83478.1 L-glutamate gamma-semialdehyde dehydrogenase [Spirosoma sp. KCTC 42546]
MSFGLFNAPTPANEPVKEYRPNSPERGSLKNALAEFRAQETDIPMYIGGKEIRTDRKFRVAPPHDHHHTLGYFYEGDAKHVEQAIESCLAAKEAWANLPWEQRASIFLKAADLIAGPYRAILNAATMLGQSKNAYQAEIDSACELIDFLRFNVHYATEIYQQQPNSSPGVWNRLEYRPLEGFVFALTPFNFTAIAGNLPTSAALMGNTVIWKPAYSQVLSAKVIMDVLNEAGLPAGVINLIYVDGPVAGDIIFNHSDFAGIHFTGSTGVFQQIWGTIGANIHKYKSYPRIVGETGGKDFVLVHESASAEEVATGLVRGAFEYQGQKCSAASRAYIPSTLWPAVEAMMKQFLSELKMGGTEDFSNFINAVIDERAFKKITAYIAEAILNDQVQLIAGGNYDSSKGYFIEPTVLKVNDPRYRTMCEEIFGPVLSVYIYEPGEFDSMVEVINSTSPYALTGSIFAKDRYVIEQVSKQLQNAAGNFYINDKPTGAVVGQQPFGGARASGTNDKAGSALNLYRWVSARTIKETFVSPKRYEYPFLEAE